MATVMPNIVLAEGAGGVYSESFSILDTYTFWSSVIVALMAIVSIVVIARKMKGGVFGETLNLFASGMFAILLGFILGSTTIFESMGFLSPIGDIMFIVGFLLMALAGNLMSRAVTG